LGPDRVVTVNGVSMTEGDLIAMGDFYASPQDMYRAAPAELQRLVDLIHRDRAARTGTPGSAIVTNDEWNQATGGRYTDLAAANLAHFAPGAAGTPNHRDEWQKLHHQALDEAHASATGDKQVPEHARGVNSFASHFLTDAFSAGHLVSKQELMDAARKHWDAMKTSGWIFKENAFTQTVARRLLADPGIRARIDDTELRVLVWGSWTEERLSELLHGLAGDSPDMFFSVFAKLVHDKLDEAIRGTTPDAGLEVENARGDTWRLSGDGTLNLSPRTRDIAAAAVAQADRNLEEAASTPGDLGYDALFQRVWAFTPRPTKSGQAMIEDFTAKYTDPAQPEAVDAFVTLAIAEFDTVLAKLRDKDRVRDKPTGRFPPGTRLPDGKYVPGYLPGGAYIDSNGNVTVKPG
jgi:hypothetical protein